MYRALLSLREGLGGGLPLLPSALATQPFGRNNLADLARDLHDTVAEFGHPRVTHPHHGGLDNHGDISLSVVVDYRSTDAPDPLERLLIVNAVAPVADLIEFARKRGGRL